MITIAFNEENEEDQEEQINSSSEKINAEPIKEKLDNGKEKVKSKLKDKKVIKFIASHITPMLIILAIIILIIVIIGQYAFFTTMPGMLLEKVKEFGVGVWSKFKSDFHGFFSGDSITTNITKEEVLGLAQYLQNMGYDIESCGFGKAEYEETSDENQSMTKQLISVGESVDGKEYLKSYIASNEATYVLSNFSLKGFLKEEGSTLTAFVRDDPSEIVLNNEYSTGMINILDTMPILPSERFVKIDRDKEKMTVYTDAVYLPIIGKFSDWLGLTNNGSIQWGSTFSYDMSTWTAKYGKPVELFLSVHLATMMPDLAYRIAKDQDLNTKVNIVLQNINVKYETKIKSIGNNVDEQEEDKILDGKDLLTGDDIIDAFLNYSLHGQKYKYEDEEEKPVEKGNSVTTEKVTVEKETNFYDEILKKLNEEGNESEKRKFFRNIIKQIQSNWNPDALGINVANALIDESETGLARFVKKVSNHLKSLVQRLFTGESEYIVYVTKGDEEVPGLKGITYNDLAELADIVGQGIEGGVDGVKWPYIQSVTNHWFYNDIDFSVGVYRKASTAKKKIRYVSADEEGSFLSKDNIVVSLEAVLTADEGIVYQVCEPEAFGPNQHIVDIFRDKYYKYDGTAQTARAIDNAKLYDQKGIFGTVETPEIEKEEVSFEENKANALAAFSILENMHSEEAELAYRNLKDLVVTLNYFTKTELTSELKNSMLWLIETNDKNEEFRVTKDENEYGMKIENVEGRNVLAPENCEISSEGDVVTLKFTQMSDETVELLKYIYEKDYKEINPDILVGLTMKIKGIKNLSQTGSVKRGTVIGTADSELQIIMFDIDKSIIENVEEYMTPEHNSAYEAIMKEKMTEEHQEGIDIGRVYGDGFFRSEGKGEDGGNSAVSTGHGTWIYSESDFDILCAITRAEAGNNPDEFINVITTACNRADQKYYGLNDPLSQYRKNYQFVVYGVKEWGNYGEGAYKQYLGRKLW